MDNIPRNTREENRVYHRENMSFPSALPSVANGVYGSVMPNYDRNMFSMGSVNIERRVENDRLDVNVIGNQQHNHFMRPVNPLYNTNVKMGTTRERRDEKKYLDENWNNERFFMANRDYGRETMDRMNGFSIIPKDTRYEGHKRMDIPEMRGNRTMGVPYEKMN